MKETMNTKIVDTAEDLENFVAELEEENKWAIDVVRDNAQYVVRWIPMKSYTTYTGEVANDELWVTENGEMKLIQDLTESHAKNILRMLIKQDRETREVIGKFLMSGIVADAVDIIKADDSFVWPADDKKPPTLH